MAPEARQDSELLAPGTTAVGLGAALFADALAVGNDVGPAQSPLLDGRVSSGVVDDVDGYEKSVGGISIRSMRTGRGDGPNTVLAADVDDFVATSVDVGFPMLNRTSMADDRIAVSWIRSAPGGTRWSGIDLAPGAVVIYSPGAEHVGINPVGLSFAFTVFAVEAIEELADRLGRRYRPPPQGSVSSLASLPQATAFGDALSSFVQAASLGSIPRADRRDDVLYRATAVLSDDRPSWSFRNPRKIDSRRLVGTCLEYAEAIGRAPTIRELCLVAHVSDRLLRKAFAAECAMPPTAFFRLWALNEAHHRLRTADRRCDTVANVAMDLGLYHLGRFAERYARLFGEPPQQR